MIRALIFLFAFSLSFNSFALSGMKVSHGTMNGNPISIYFYDSESLNKAVRLNAKSSHPDFSLKTSGSSCSGCYFYQVYHRMINNNGSYTYPTRIYSLNSPVPVSLDECTVISPDKSTCLIPDEGCEDLTSSFTTSSSSNCLTLSNGSSCQSSCGDTGCIGVGVGGNDPVYVQSLTGSSCVPSETPLYCDGTNCSLDPIYPPDTGGGDTGGGDTGGGDTGGGDTGGGDTGGGDTGGGDTGGGDTGGGDTGGGSIGGGSVSTGGGSSSGDAVDAPNTDQGKDYSSQLNQLIANQDAVNKTGIEILKNQSAIFSELKAINSNIAFSNSQSVKSNGLLSEISDGIKSLNEEKLYDVPDTPENTSLQETIVDFGSFDSIIKKDYFGGSAVCPPDVSIVVMGTDLAFTYKPFCDFAAMVKPLVLLLAWGGFIFSLRHIGRN